MSLSRRDRAKINAALVAINGEGYNPREVIGMAQAIMDTGSPPRVAYERAFNKFTQRNPGLASGLQRIGQFIDATDDRTLAGYNVALSRYIEHDVAAPMMAMLPAMQRDLMEMAARTGDAGFTEGLEAMPAPEPAPTPAAAPSGPGWGAEGYRPSEAGTASPAAPAAAPA
jgi:hypothetical protein